MSALPSFITFTGLDAWTDLRRVANLSSRYPIEWGVLFSPKRQGVDPRYPDGETLSAIMWMAGIQKAAHLCGDHARSIMQSGECGPIPVDLFYFDRVQVNHASPDPLAINAFRDGWGRFRCIAQSRGSEFPADTSVDWLHDLSGGRGEAGAFWPEHPGRLVGYAGGINPENVASVIAGINADAPYWIDMESGVRTDDRLDLDKCEAVCRAVYGPSPTDTRDAGREQREVEHG